LDHEAFASAMVMAPTVMAAGARAGLVLAASVPSFPAATATGTPALAKAVMALSTVVEAPPPSDMDATEGRPVFGALDATQLIPDMTSELEPELDIKCEHVTSHPRITQNVPGIGENLDGNDMGRFGDTAV
jgi:hypothetical protein